MGLADELLASEVRVVRYTVIVRKVATENARNGSFKAFCLSNRFPRLFTKFP